MRITLSHPYDHSSSARVFLLARVHVIYLSAKLAITARLSTFRLHKHSAVRSTKKNL